MNFSRSILRAFCLLFLLSGCVGRLPVTEPIASADREQALALLSSFFKQSHCDWIDLDLELSWQAYGSKESFSATMQAGTPALLRLAVVDPLGQPQVLFVADGTRFSLADKRTAEGVEGLLSSKYVQRFVPASVLREDVFYWLSGRTRAYLRQDVRIYRDHNSSRLWYQYEDAHGLSHWLELAQHHLMRHMLFGADGTLFLDVRYSDYAGIEGHCVWPSSVRITGDHLPAELLLAVKKIYGTQPKDKQIFHFDMPTHFTVQIVE